MEIAAFIRIIENEFEEVTPDSLKQESCFREMDGWSSMHALIFVALIDHHYKVLLNGEELKSASTIGDLFNIVNSKIASGEIND